MLKTNVILNEQTNAVDAWDGDRGPVVTHGFSLLPEIMMVAMAMKVEMRQWMSSLKNRVNKWRGKHGIR